MCGAVRIAMRHARVLVLGEMRFEDVGIQATSTEVDSCELHKVHHSMHHSMPL